MERYFQAVIGGNQYSERLQTLNEGKALVLERWRSGGEAKDFDGRVDEWILPEWQPSASNVVGVHMPATTRSYFLDPETGGWRE